MTDLPLVQRLERLIFADTIEPGMVIVEECLSWFTQSCPHGVQHDAGGGEHELTVFDRRVVSDTRRDGDRVAHLIVITETGDQEERNLRGCSMVRIRVTA